MEVHLERIPRTLELKRDGDGLCLSYVDQRFLPDSLRFVEERSWRAVVDAIKKLSIRGAPAIGVAGAAALALWASFEPSGSDLDAVAAEIASARPTAVNLCWAVQRARKAALGVPRDQLADRLYAVVKEMEASDELANRSIGQNGASLLDAGSRVLTHCNAGSLATVFYGTALGVVYAAAQAGGIARVYADETRPVGQGARLTAWELSRAGIPVTLICDNMAASLMASGEVDAVVVGADRIARNGDVANKVGTYGVAVLAKEHGIPVYVAAPMSTVDSAISDGSRIVIEQRDCSEVLPNPIDGVEVWNPAFDVTPARYIDKIVTEMGVFSPEELSARL